MGYTAGATTTDLPAANEPTPNDRDRFPSSEQNAENTPLLAPDSRPREEDDSERNHVDTSDVPPHALDGPIKAWSVVIGMAILILINGCNIIGMTVAQSAIAADLDAYTSTTWFTTVFLTVASALTPLLSRLAGIFSPTALVPPMALLLAAGALASGLAPSLAIFLAGRALAGAGAAAVLSLGMILVLELASPRHRGLWLGVLHSGYTAGAAIGAVLFGSLLESVGWRPLMCYQAPLSLLGGLLLYASLPASLSYDRPKPSSSSSSSSPSPSCSTPSTLTKLSQLDYAGALLLTLTFILFLSALAQGSADLTLLLLLCIPTLLLFLLVEFRFTPDPIIPLTVLSSRGVLLSCLAHMGLMSSRFAVLYFTPLAALAVRAMRPAAAAALLVPTNIGFSLGGILVGWAHVRRTTPYWTASVVSVLLGAATLLVLAPLSAGAGPVAALAVVVLLNGLVSGAAMTYTVAHALHHSEPAADFVTSSLMTTFRGFGGSLGTAVGGAAFYGVLGAQLESGFRRLDGGAVGGPLSPARARLVEKLMGSPALVWSGELDAAERAVALGGYEGAARGVFLAATALAVASAVVQAGTGWRSGLRSG